MLRDEAVRNVDFRYKAEQELESKRIETQRDHLRPHMMDMSAAINQPMRRSMAMNGYEQLFFA